MLETSNDIEFLESHLFESYLATITALFILIGMPLITYIFRPGMMEEMLSDTGILFVGSILVLIFRTRDIFPARKRIKELKGNK